MVNAFQEQLLNVGLVDKKKVAKVKKDTFKKNRKQRSQNIQSSDENKLSAIRALDEKKEKDRLLNLQKEEKLKAKAILAQIKQMIMDNQLTGYRGEISFNFQDQNKVKKINLCDSIHQSLSLGHIALVKYEQQYYLLPAKVAEKIAQRDESYILVLNDKKSSSENPAIIDEYADYEIPDDLMW